MIVPAHHEDMRMPLISWTCVMAVPTSESYSWRLDASVGCLPAQLYPDPRTHDRGRGVSAYRPFVDRFAMGALLPAGLYLFIHLVEGETTLLGMLTGIGVGLTRDVLLAEIPTVLRADLYAVAALAGAAVVVAVVELAVQRGWIEH
jgi:hypothetical protein